MSGHETEIYWELIIRYLIDKHFPAKILLLEFKIWSMDMNSIKHKGKKWYSWEFPIEKEREFQNFSLN